MIATTSIGSFVVNLGKLSTIPHGERREFRVGGRSIAVIRAEDSRILATDSAQKTYPVAVNDQGDVLLGIEKLW